MISYTEAASTVYYQPCPKCNDTELKRPFYVAGTPETLIWTCVRCGFGVEGYCADHKGIAA